MGSHKCWRITAVEEAYIYKRKQVQEHCGDVNREHIVMIWTDHLYFVTHYNKGVSVHIPSVTYIAWLRVESAYMLQHEKYFNRPTSSVSCSVILLIIEDMGSNPAIGDFFFLLFKVIC